MRLFVEVNERLGAFALEVAFRSPGEGITALFGPSGAGKSATLAAIAGTARAPLGRIAFGDEVWLDSARGLNVPPERRRVGLVHQDARLFPHMNVQTNLLYGWRRVRPEARRIGLDEVVGVLGIGHLLARRTAALSGGERQRVALGRALLAQPRLLLLDEPVSALDAVARGEALGLIGEVGRGFGVPMIYVTHSIEEARAVASHVLLIENGRVVATGGRELLDAAGGTTGVVIAHDRASGTMRLEADGRALVVPWADVAVGARVRVGVWTDG